MKRSLSQLEFRCVLGVGCQQLLLELVRADVEDLHQLVLGVLVFGQQLVDKLFELFQLDVQHFRLKLSELVNIHPGTIGELGQQLRGDPAFNDALVEVGGGSLVGFRHRVGDDKHSVLW